MQEQEYRLVIPKEKVYNQIYQDHLRFLKQAKIMVSDYYDSPEFRLLRDGIVLRFRIDDGRSIVQIKKKIRVTADNLFISESKEDEENKLEDSKDYRFIMNLYENINLQKVLTMRTMRQHYYCEDFDFILDKTQYENQLTGMKGTLFGIEMEILSLNKGEIKFIREMEQKYQLQKSRYTKMEMVLFNHLN